MKAVVLDKNNQLINTEVDLRALKPNEMKIKIIASAINPIDYQMRENAYERRYLSSAILGREGAGIITEIGSKVADFSIGDETFFACGSMGSNGTYAEYIILPSEIVAHKPRNISFNQAAALPSAGITALQVFDRAPIKHNDRVLLTGASGGVGLFVLKLLLANGIQQLVVTAGNTTSISKLNALGLSSNRIVDYKQKDLIETLRSKIDHGYFDVCIDAVGHHLSEVSASVLKPNGCYVDITHFATQKATDILFGSAAQIINISHFIHAKNLNYTHFKNLLNRVKNLMEQEIISPMPIQLIGKLDRDDIENGQQQLKNNKTKGDKLIIHNQS